MGAADQLDRGQHIGQLAAKGRQADQRIAEPLLAPETGREVVGSGKTDHQIQLTLFQLPLVVAVGQLAHLQPAVGRCAEQAIHQQRHQPVLYRTRGGDAEDPPRAGRFESLGLTQPLLQHRQRLPHRPGQRLGALGRHHLPSAHHEERVIQRDPQPTQRMADGGLGEMQPLGGAGDVALLHQHVEYGEQVEVEAGERAIHRY